MRYLGRDAARAAEVREELWKLQEPRRTELELARLDRTARRMVRDAKATLAPLLAEQGFTFHGNAVRRRRAHGDESSINEMEVCLLDCHQQVREDPYHERKKEPCVLLKPLPSDISAASGLLPI